MSILTPQASLTWVVTEPFELTSHPTNISKASQPSFMCLLGKSGKSSPLQILS